SSCSPPTSTSSSVPASRWPCRGLMRPRTMSVIRHRNLRRGCRRAQQSPDPEVRRLVLAVEEVQPGHSIGLARGEALVCVPVHGFSDLVHECLDRLLKYTQSSAVLVADDATPGSEVLR